MPRKLGGRRLALGLSHYHAVKEVKMPTNLPDPDELNDERAHWAETALRGFAYEVSGPQGLEDLRQLDHVASNFLCDLAHLADQRGWKLVDVLRVARAAYELETEGQGEQFDGFEQLVV